MNKKWETPPMEASENLTSLNIDRRTLTKTGRVYQLGTRVKKEFLEQLKLIAYEERLKYVEVLEKALECYKKYREDKNRCSQCLKKRLEMDSCDECGKNFCAECLTYYEEESGELAFCSKCKK
jgi:HSP90 family molecular chaperone